MRATVNARGRLLRTLLLLSALNILFAGGAGEMSMALGDIGFMPAGTVGGLPGGELRDMVEAKECSKSEERKSSTSLAASVRMRRSLGLREGAGGGFRCLEERVEKKPGILRFCSERLRFLLLWAREMARKAEKDMVDDEERKMDEDVREREEESQCGLK